MGRTPALQRRPVPHSRARGVVSHTATNSARSLCFSNTSASFFEIRPQLASAKRTRRTDFLTNIGARGAVIGRESNTTLLEPQREDPLRDVYNALRGSSAPGLLSATCPATFRRARSYFSKPSTRSRPAASTRWCEGTPAPRPILGCVRHL